jgi:hypothetical protein
VSLVTDHPEAVSVLVVTIVLGVLRVTFPKDSRHRLELWKAVLEHRRRRWQVTERRRATARQPRVPRLTEAAPRANSLPQPTPEAEQGDPASPAGRDPGDGPLPDTLEDHAAPRLTKPPTSAESDHTWS